MTEPVINKLLDIMPVSLEEEMKKSYLDYAMSVIVSRALPDVRDGLKPVHRRILYAMKQGGLDYNKGYRKSARVVGDVIAKYHPHGESAVYDSMVRMAQDFSMRLPLVDGQGNFGSMDGDSAAAMRYTEARLSHAAHYLLEDIEKDTVDFRPNYDEREFEPTVLPARFPNMLVNGAGGIAVGMATNIPPHNLGEVIDACCAYIENPDITTEELMAHVPAPDFPTGAQIIGRGGSMEAYRTGRGSILIRGKTEIEEIRDNRFAIIVNEVPYQVNKAKMLERIAELVNTKVIEGISDLRDESDRDGVRMVIELKRDADANVVLHQLYKHTPLQTSFGCNMVALDGGRPLMMTLKAIIVAFIKFREEVITRRTQFELRKAREKAHVYLGLAVAVSNIDEMIALIRSAPDPQEARELMMARAWPAEDIASLIALVDDVENPAPTYKLSEQQARAILDLRLHRLTGLERDKIAKDLQETIDSIKGFLKILRSRTVLLDLLKEELLEVKEKFATPRRSEIIDGVFSSDMEDLIQREEMVVTVTHGGYIKRVPLSTYRTQRRGGKGRSGMATRDEDFVDQVFVANTHTPILFFSSKGMVYNLKVYSLPEASAQSRGKALVNMLPLSPNEKITTIMPMPENEESWEGLQIIFATSHGNIRRNMLSDFTNIRANGKIAMKLEGDESLVDVATCNEQNDCFVTTRAGKCVRFSVTDVRVFVGRNSTGVRGIRLADGDLVVSMSILDHGTFTIEERDAYLSLSRKARGEEEGSTATSSETLSTERYQEMAASEQFILTVSEKGFGKRTSAYEYRISNRGGQGIANMEITDKTGLVVASFPVKESDQLMLITDGGQLIRSALNEVRIAGRKTQGVRLFRVESTEKVVAAACVAETETEEAESIESEEGSVTEEVIQE